jgi:hypothetical protein
VPPAQEKKRKRGGGADSGRHDFLRHALVTPFRFAPGPNEKRGDGADYEGRRHPDGRKVELVGVEKCHADERGRRDKENGNSEKGGFRREPSLRHGRNKAEQEAKQADAERGPYNGCHNKPPPIFNEVTLLLYTAEFKTQINKNERRKTAVYIHYCQLRSAKSKQGGFAGWKRKLACDKHIRKARDSEKSAQHR